MLKSLAEFKCIIIVLFPETEKSCVCAECGMTFKIPDALRKHMYVHQTER